MLIPSPRPFYRLVNNYVAPASTLFQRNDFLRLLSDDGKGLDAKLLSATEGADVRDFLVREQKNGGVLMLMLHFLEALCDRSELVWPQELASVYVRVYIRRRRHTDLPCLLRSEQFMSGYKYSRVSCISSHFVVLQVFCQVQKF